MSYQNKGTAAGMRRHADMIRKKIESGQSRASLRREMIDQKFIRACSEAHFLIRLASCSRCVPIAVTAPDPEIWFVSTP